MKSFKQYLKEDWWSDLGSKGQEAYIQSHPNSKKAKEARAEQSDEKSTSKGQDSSQNIGSGEVEKIKGMGYQDAVKSISNKLGLDSNRVKDYLQYNNNHGSSKDGINDLISYVKNSIDNEDDFHLYTDGNYNVKTDPKKLIKQLQSIKKSMSDTSSSSKTPEIKGMSYDDTVKTLGSKLLGGTDEQLISDWLRDTNHTRNDSRTAVNDLITYVKQVKDGFEEDDYGLVNDDPDVILKKLNDVKNSLNSKETKSSILSKSPNTRLNIAKNSKASPEDLKELAGDSSEYVREKVASNASAPSEALDKLANDSDAYVITGLLRNPKVSADNIKTIFKNKENLKKENPYLYNDILKGVAKNSNTSIDILKTLAKDKTDEVRGEVAYNEHTPVETLRELSNDSYFSVRSGLSRHDNAPADVLKKLAGDKSEYIRQNVASHSNTPVETLRSLAKDSDPEVRENVAGNENTPVETLKELARTGKERVLFRVGLNPNTPEDVLRSMYTSNKTHNDRWATSALAQNVNTPEDILRELAQSEDEFVSKKAKKSLKAKSK